jgi:hypothetical protein
METLLVTATAVEDNVLDTMKLAEDAVVRTARTFAEGLEPITKRMPEVPLSGLLSPRPSSTIPMASSTCWRPTFGTSPTGSSKCWASGLRPYRRRR